MTSAVSDLDAAILTSLIVWPDRTRRRRCKMAALGTADATAFKTHFAALYPRLRMVVSDTEIDACWEALKKQAPDYRAWWSRLLTSGGLELDFVDREPLVALKSLERWERTLDRLDADALVTRALVDRRAAADIDADVRSLENWGTVVKASDRELETLWRRGLSDLHIHVGGVRFAQAHWFDYMDNLVDASAAAGIGRDAAMVAMIAEARAARERLWTLVGPKPFEEEPLRDDGERWWRWDCRRLIGERLLLGRCWRLPDMGDHIVDLDVYLGAKSRFMSIARQPFETAPGLDNFIGYTGRLKGRKGRAEDSARLVMQPFGDALAFLTESRDLRRAELRFAPEPSVSAMGRYAEYFGQLVTRFNKARGKRSVPLAAIDARMAFHLKRSRGKAGRAATLSGLLCEMDRQTAALRLALTDSAFGPPLRKWLARLDIAGQERDTSIVECAPYIRLAIGDDEALADLRAQKKNDPRRPEYEHWAGLLARGEDRASLTERRLGVTIHSGEDFADPLSGLHEIASAVDFVKLGPGDGIGHGLALVTDGAAFVRDRGGYAMIPRGAHIDSLVWLIGLMDTQGYREAPALRHKLQACAEVQAQIAYQRRVQLLDIAWLRRARSRCETPPIGQLDRPRVDLWAMHADAAVRERLDELIALPESRIICVEALAWAQEEVMREVKNRRIIVELNPASNLRVSGSGSTDLSPTTRLLLHSADGLLTSINTDNPGTFLSRIENEYALLLIGCRQKGVPEWKIRELLEQARRVGLEFTYWPDQAE